jgi:hypothetical protein
MTYNLARPYAAALMVVLDLQLDTALALEAVEQTVLPLMADLAAVGVMDEAVLHSAAFVAAMA